VGAAALPGVPGAAPARELRLPPLREDLQLLPAPPAPDGSPCWTIFDPVRNRYFRIGDAAFEAIARWHLAIPGAIAEAVNAETTAETDEEAVMALFKFLAGSNLTQTVDTEFLGRQAASRKVSWYVWLLHNYLFFRIPLVRPDRFLLRTAHLVAPLTGRAWRAALIACGLLGVVLVLRQWDAFLHTFLHFFSVEGMVFYGLTLGAAKTLHELGHAYAAKRHGCRVPTMGIAFLVLWPVLYTDTSDAWRLVSRKARLEIAAAGMLTELALAGLATLTWSFLPDGPARSAAFFVATVGWVSTLTINLSPFMRFDGYYLLADTLDVPNLQERSFALARWRLREWLFGLGEEPPERFAPWLRRTMLAYAFATWVYRLVLFIGIALIVYHMFAKVLGLFLFAIEIGWFVMRPIASEAVAWWRLRRSLRPNLNTLMTLGALGGLLWLAFMPVTATVAVPVLWRSSAFATVFTPVPARLEVISARPGQRVAEGEVLFRLSSPELENRLTQSDLRIALAQEQIDRYSSAREGLERLRAMEEELAAALTERRGLLDNRDRLTVRAPLEGRVVDIADGLRHGRWINPKLPLAQVVGDGPEELVGYVGEADLERIQPGAAARFHPDDPLQPRFAARVRAVDRVAAANLDLPALASQYGGPVAVEGQPGTPGGRPNLSPVTAVYRIALTPEEGRGRPAWVTRGIVRVDAEARSLAGRFWRTAVAVLIRETGF
jgi:putative peptide zinc metalloprotease protein